MLIFDAHLDLSMNAMEWNRDLTRPLEEIRQRERHLDDKPDRGRGTVCVPEMRRGRIGVCAATLIARYVKPGNPLPGWHSPEQAWAQTQGQLAWYRAMEERGELCPIGDRAELDWHVARWQTENPDTLPIGFVLTLEGADSILSRAYLERAYAQGLRALGLSHYGPGTYAQGTESTGGLNPRGRDLLEEMDRLGIMLDVTHLSDESFWEALDHFRGIVWASHCNCRALVPLQRQLSDEQIKALIDRGAVIGTAFDAWMLVPGWVRGKSLPGEMGVTLQTVVEHMDHVCQIAGNSRHSGIGSDLDGAFGTEQGPADVNSIADLARLPVLLSGIGYAQADITGIMSENFLNLLRRALPA
jgi:membrane dipeptidase